MKNILLCDNSRAAETVTYCREFNLGIEIQAFADPRYFDDHPEGVEFHRQLTANIYPLAMHGCFGDLSPGSFDPLVREVARSRFELSFQVACRLGAGHLVLHDGYVPKTNSLSGWVKRASIFWRDFLAEKPGHIQIHMENLLEWEPDLLFDLLMAIDCPQVDINLDIGHAHCNSRTPVISWVEKLGSRIGYVHMHDNYGEWDDHLGLGQGTLPLEETCEALNRYAPDALWALEVNVEDMPDSLEWLAKRGFFDLTREQR